MIIRGLFIGRFQPPHKGHLFLMEQILKQCDELIIVIAAAQISHTLKNPLTAGERVTLLKSMLDNSDIPPSKYYLIPVEDVMDNAIWVYHVKRMIPKFNYFYGNNPFTTYLFEEAGFKTKNTELYDRNRYEGTKIREMIIHSKDIGELLDPKVIELLDKWQINKRLQSLLTNTDPQRGTELLKDDI